VVSGSRPSPLAQRLGERVRALRLERSLTQERLAWEADISKPYLCQVEAGKRLPSLLVLDSLARRLGVELVDLLIFDTAAPRLQLLEASRLADRPRLQSALRRLKLD
jgi:transcriptional regulator with XRE-family HTH domain